MPATAPTTRRTDHVLALMAKGDELFNARDWEALEPGSCKPPLNCSPPADAPR